jgi:acetolactate synthase-1/2/3 large subunit
MAAIYQNKYFDEELASGEHTGVTLPDIEKTANSYNIDYYRLNNHENIVENIKNILSHPGPSICEVMMLHTHQSLPRSSAYKGKDGKFVALPMEDMLPLLPRDEFEENMKVGDE